MKKIFFVATMLFISLSSFSQKLSADQIIGKWQSEDYKIEIFKSGTTYSAKLLWSKEMFETDGKTPKKDSKNPDIKLKNRSIQGITHITGLKYDVDENEFVNGELYSAQNGMILSFKAELKSLNNLESRVYKGVPMMGKTVKWTRVK